MNLQINYHHLRYFLAVAEQGGVTAAAKATRVSAPTLSAQVASLEGFFGTALFLRVGRRMVLTDAGRVVKRYAARIVQLGDELAEVGERGDWGRGEAVTLGLADTVPKILLSRILSLALGETPGLRVSVREGLGHELFPALAAHQLDLVFASEPPAAQLRAGLYDRCVSRHPVRFAAAAGLAKRFRRSWDGFPVLLPTTDSPLRRKLDAWWAGEGIVPLVRAEFDDLAAMYELAAEGMGAVPISFPVGSDLLRRYRLEDLKVRTGLQDELHVVTAEREFPSAGAGLLAALAARE